jgi:hypothetical protein
MPLNADGCLVDQTPLSTQSFDIQSHAPPLYGEHVLDQLYADMDQSGLMTPAPQSGMNTPYNALSRTGSSENLASLGNSATTPNGAVPPAALSSRLQNLNSGSRNNSFLRRHVGSGSGGNTPHSAPHNDEGGYFDNHNSSNSSNPLSRRTSEEEDHHPSNMTSGQHTPEHVDYSDPGYTEILSKVPSYSTAVKAPLRGMSYTEAGALPNYETATSTPPSPERTFSSPAATPADTGHRRNQLSNLGFTPIGAPPPVHLGDGDERRRLHWLQSSRERAH